MVGIERDAAESFGFALGAEHAVRNVQTFQLRIGLGMNVRSDGQFKFFGRIENRQSLVVNGIFFGFQRAAVDRNPRQRQFVAVQIKGADFAG